LIMTSSKMGKPDPKLVLSSTKNNVTTLTMNDPKKLNGWTGPMMLTLRDRFVQHAKDDNTKVLILTGADPYYCAGVNLSATIQPMHPRKLHQMIRENNQAVFDAFLDFPKPIIIAANGPAIGACVTSASLCDAIIASDQATFLVPFARLSIPPEGCSSVHFERLMGPEAAKKMLAEGWKPTAVEAKEIVWSRMWCRMKSCWKLLRFLVRSGPRRERRKRFLRGELSRSTRLSMPRSLKT